MADSVFASAEIIQGDIALVEDNTCLSWIFLISKCSFSSKPRLMLLIWAQSAPRITCLAVSLHTSIYLLLVRLVSDTFHHRRVQTFFYRDLRVQV